MYFDSHAHLDDGRFQEDFDDILVCYNCTNFLTDTTLPLLR